MNEDLQAEIEDMVIQLTEEHVTFRYDYELEEKVLEREEPLLEVLRQVKFKQRKATGSGTGAPSTGSRVSLSFQALDVEREIIAVTGLAGCTGSLEDRIKAYGSTAKSWELLERSNRLCLWIHQILEMIVKKVSTLDISGSCPECGSERARYMKPGGVPAIGTALQAITDIAEQRSQVICRACHYSWSHNEIPGLALNI